MASITQCGPLRPAWMSSRSRQGSGRTAPPSASPSAQPQSHCAVAHTRRVLLRTSHGGLRLGSACRCVDASSPAPATGDEIKERFRQRTLDQLTEMAVTGGQDRETFQQNIRQLDTLVGQFAPNMNALKESQWVLFISDAPDIARKMILLKTYFPSLDIPKLVERKPKLFLKDIDELKTISKQVLHLLAEAPDPGAILSGTPDLFDPSMVASVLISFQRWFPKDDPIKILQESGESVLKRAQEQDKPLDPVYYDGTSWKGPSFDTQFKQLPWQEHIRTKVNKLPPLNTLKIADKYKPE